MLKKFSPNGTVSTVTVSANTDAATVAANSAVWVNATADDTASNGATLSIIGLNLSGTKGTAKLNSSAPNGFQYSPNGAFAYLSAGQTATDTLQYMVSDGAGHTSVATAIITVTGTNAPPVAASIAATDTATGTIAINALAQATDLNLADTLTISGLKLSNTKGTATIDPATGTIHYNPNGAFAYLSAGQTATDTLQYTVADNHGGTSTARIAISVTGVNTPPVAVADMATMTANGNYVNLVPLGNDTDINKADKLTVVAIDTTGTKGEVIVNTSTNTITYEPHQIFAYLSAGETATDTFTYTISDGHGGFSTATETITVTGVNAAPSAGTATASVGAYSTVAINALANVGDLNIDDTHTITALNLGTAKGTATIDPMTGMIDYDPNGASNYLSAGQTAIDSFQYTVADDHGGVSTGWVSVAVSGVNVAPVATSQTGTVGASSCVWLNVAPYDADTNRADTLSIISIDLTGTLGTGWLNPSAPNGFNYAPNGAFNYLSAGETATDTLHYTVSDNHGATSTGVMTITVSGVNKAPVATNNSGSTYADQSITFNVLANATDVNRDDVLT
ncbi:MAG: tandem-95 repeat protein, partial [Proteobacteria bacterium]|nr:tandem-95 repeat protein [Pseudomonadota bacterium]